MTTESNHELESATPFTDVASFETVSENGHTTDRSTQTDGSTRPAYTTNTDREPGWYTASNEPDTQSPLATRLKQMEDQIYGVLCNSSCTGICDSSSPHPDSHCYCDAACQLMGDCCLDYEATCASGPTVTRDNYVDIVRSRQPLPAECITFWANQFSSNTIVVVTSCVTTNTQDDNAVMRRLCQRPLQEERNITTELPVMFRDVIYRNRYCAKCNNPGIDFSEVKEPSLKVYCGKSSSKAREIWRQKGTDAFVSYAITACTLHINMSRSGGFLRDFSRYHCGWDAGIPRSCEPTKDPNEPYLLSVCQRYRADVGSFFIPPYHYRNPHCAACMGASVTELTCPFLSFPMVQDPNVPPLPSFSLLLDFSGAQHLAYDKALCPAHMLHDYTRDTCVIRTCPPGHVGLREKKLCTKMNATVEQILSGRSNTVITVVTVIQLPYDVTSRDNEFVEESVKLIIEHVPLNDIKPVVNMSYQTACVNLTDSFLERFEDKYWNSANHDVTCFAFRLSNIQFRQIMPHINVIRNDIILALNNSTNVEVMALFVMNHDISEILGVCSSGTSRIPTQLILLGHDMSRDVFPSAFVVADTSLTYATDDVPFAVSWRRNTSDDFVWVEQYAALICEPDVLTCKTVTLLEDEYIEMGNSFLLLNKTNISQQNVLKLDSDAIILCASLLPNTTTVQLTIAPDNRWEDYIMGLLTLIGNVLSMICLIATMVTYCLFRSLRTLPGKCIMNLTVSLFLAQFTFQLGGPLVSYRDACVAIGVLQHYAWLAAFFWMNVLSFNTCITFVSLKPSYNTMPTARLRFFALYAWGLPAVVIAICLSIDLATKLPFSYGGTTGCFIVGHNAVLFYFAIPLIVIIAANTACFARTICALRSAFAIGNQARTSQQQHRSTLAIYVRLTSLMGFTWLFGFLANVDALHFCWYLFIVCNTLQGVFIYFSFALSQQSRQLWRGSLHTFSTESDIFRFIKTSTLRHSPNTSHTSRISHDCQDTQL